MIDYDFVCTTMLTPGLLLQVIPPWLHASATGCAALPPFTEVN